LTVKDVAATPPKVTPVVFCRPSPVTVTVVPPPVGPVAGAIEVVLALGAWQEACASEIVPRLTLTAVPTSGTVAVRLRSTSTAEAEAVVAVVETTRRAVACSCAPTRPTTLTPAFALTVGVVASSVSAWPSRLSPTTCASAVALAPAEQTALAVTAPVLTAEMPSTLMLTPAISEVAEDCAVVRVAVTLVTLPVDPTPSPLSAALSSPVWLVPPPAGAVAEPTTAVRPTSGRLMMPGIVTPALSAMDTPVALASPGAAAAGRGVSTTAPSARTAAISAATAFRA
jgi:hypothetical protein